MKMVKSLLLGSAAGVVAVAGAQAADLPVKAKAVEYVKICSLYGAGFYYIPGTDICMKVGGYIRFQENFANGGASTSNGPTEGTGGRNTRTDSQDWIMRTRAVATFDTRQQTQYGVLRTYLLMGFQQDSTSAPTTAPAVYITRGFIQIAGFTFGKATSYFDFFPRAAIAYNAGTIFSADTGDSGQMLAAYTAQFGGGVSASIAAENSQRKGTLGLTAGFTTPFAAPTAFSNLGEAGTVGTVTGNPDIVANLRWDGAWGAFQLAGALHDASGGYYGGGGTGTENLGHPSNKWGYAISPGLRINAPMIGPGDYFVINYAYTVGAPQLAASGNSNFKLITNGGSVGFGLLADGVFGGASSAAANASNVELQTAWSTAVAYEHFWTPALQTSLYGSYLKTSWSGTANNILCTGSATTPATVGCDPSFSMWNIGSRTQWNVVKGLYVGLDVVYSKLKTSTVPGGTVTTVAAAGAVPASTYNVSDQSAWNFAFRVHRDIVP